MEKVVCPKCQGKGAVPKCLYCGKFSYAPPESASPEQTNQTPVVIPTWYLTNHWDSTKIVYDRNPGRTRTLAYLNELVKDGNPPNFSAMYLLPPDSGKRIAAYTLIQKYQSRGYTVAPIMDITSLHILLNRNRYEDQQLLLNLFSYDAAIIYSTDFVTRKNAARIFEGVANTRALNNKPTLFFGSHTFQELSAWGTGLALTKNQVKNDKLAHPYIFDGVAERNLNGQEQSNRPTNPVDG